MTTKHDFCPGCGAQVYPEEEQCPFCGRSLRTRFMLPVVVGLSGTAVALVSGALVWWVLSAPATPVAPPVSGAPQAAASPEVPPAPSVAARVEPPQPAVPAEAPPPAAVVSPPPAAPAEPPRAVAVPAPVEPSAPPAAPPSAPSSFAPPPAHAGLEAPAGGTQAPPAHDAASAGDAESRRAFAKSKQDSFAQNGLDLQVTTSGPQDTVLVIKFNFSAKTAAELIVAGPFPKQCEQRGFKEILFQDPSGATWVYTIATQQMSVR
ncbi:hypothetical protein V5F53_09325 [Xanthobacter sp. V4C-4]|uniref:hypothetical protein n=1 Tax=Xanthobacter cornucopiae TaxID=3119924 RepID=UPI00372AB393